MANEWYLMDTNHDLLSGFEGEEIDSIASNEFEEILNSAIGYDVELYNYDLSVVKPIRAIIQDNLQNTQINTMQRKMLVKIGECKAGMYVKYKNRFWLIAGLVDDNKLYEKAILYLCNYKLAWRNKNGKIIQRWCRVQSAAQYNNGEYGNSYFNYGNDQLMIHMPDDDDCILLDNGTRFVIDKRCSVYEKGYDETITTDTSKPIAVYEVTRVDSVLNNYIESGMSAFIATQDRQHQNDGYYVIDNVGYWLCDNETEEPNDYENSPLTSEIQYDDLVIYNGLDACEFRAVFYDSNGNIDDSIQPRWEIRCDFASDLNIDYVENSVFISVDKRKLINKSFELLLSGNGYGTQSVIVTIKAFM